MHINTAILARYWRIKSGTYRINIASGDIAVLTQPYCNTHPYDTAVILRITTPLIILSARDLRLFLCSLYLYNYIHSVLRPSNPTTIQ